MPVLVYPRSAQGDNYYIVLTVLSQGSEDHTRGPHTYCIGDKDGSLEVLGGPDH